MSTVPTIAEFRVMTPDSRQAQLHERLADIAVALQDGVGGAAGGGSSGNPGQLQIKSADSNGFAALPYGGWTGTTLELPIARLYRGKVSDHDFDRLYLGWDDVNSSWVIQQEWEGSFSQAPLVIKGGLSVSLTTDPGVNRASVKVSSGDVVISNGSGIGMKFDDNGLSPDNSWPTLGSLDSPWKFLYANSIKPGTKFIQYDDVISAADHTVIISTNGVSITVSLPGYYDEVDNMILFIKRVDSNSGDTVTIDPSGSIFSENPVTLANPGGSGVSGMIIQYSHGEWRLMAKV